MTWHQAILVYFILWWLVCLAVLPFGVRREDDPQPLHDRGAPQKTNLGKKLLAATVLSALLTFGIMWAMDHTIIMLDATRADQ